MHSSASRAIDGTNSVKRVCEEPNLVFISQARNEPNASAANSGTVIMDRCGASGISDDSVPTAASLFVLLKSQVECGRSLGSLPPSRVTQLLVSGTRQLSAKLPTRKVPAVALSEADMPTKPITDILNAAYYFRMWSATE